ncbi:MAG: ferrochelatase [Betaproteobacteria bacterium]|nr:ferrochelatase [Betaproteobacteria bacterium]MDH4292730.1 ferrochelatase [Betaproteobacteria bacterium]
MSQFAKEPPYAHGTAPKIGILLINLGSPEAATPGAVRTYLREFLSDPHVVEIPRPVWWLILNLFVLTTRPGASAKRYAQVWTKEGSPLQAHTATQTNMLRGYLGERLKQPHVVEYAMRYGKPAISDKLNMLKAQGCDRILLLPLYPQYSASTTATAFNAAFAAMAKMRDQPAVRTVKHFHDNEGYVKAVAQSINDYWVKHYRGDHLVLSFHGVPRRTLDLGDPYHCECLKTGRMIAEQIGLKPDFYTVAFQSRFGRAEWLKPYTSEVLKDLAGKNVGRVDVVCPGFVSDCLETLEEIAIEAKEDFIKAGGKELHYIPCLNERDDWLHALTDIVLKNVLGWTTAATPDHLQASRDRALQLGAKR